MLRQRLEDAVRDLHNAAEKLRAETLRRDTLTAELDGIPQDVALLAQAAAIERLAEQAGAAAKALDDLPAREAELAQIEARIGQRLRSLGAPGREPASLIPARTLTTRTRNLIRGHGTHVSACTAATRTRDELAARIAAQRAEPAPAAMAAGGLAALIEEIRAAGDPGAMAQEAAAREAAAQAALARALAETPFWDGQAADLRALSVPAMPVAEAAHAALVAAETARGRDAAGLEQACERLTRAQAALR